MLPIWYRSTSSGNAQFSAVPRFAGPSGWMFQTDSEIIEIPKSFSPQESLYDLLGRDWMGAGPTVSDTDPSSFWSSQPSEIPKNDAPLMCGCFCCRGLSYNANTSSGSINRNLSGEDSVASDDVSLPASAAYSISSTKWGISQTFGTSGGNVTWSIAGAGWWNETSDSSFFIGTTRSFSSYLSFDYTSLLSQAFAAWSNVANITFTQISDGGGDIGDGYSADIRIALGYIDGEVGQNTLAKAWYPDSGNGYYAQSGDIVFDYGNTWTSSQFLAVATHEIGHSLGINHTSVANSLMNAIYNESITTPQADDIAAARAIYGPRPVSPNRAPTLTASNYSNSYQGQVIAASSLVSASDLDGDSLFYNFWDGTSSASSGYFSLNGVRQSSGVTIGVSAADLHRLNYVAGTVSDSLQVRVRDSSVWTDWTPFTVTAVNVLPTVSVTNRTATSRGQAFIASQLFTANDVNGDSLYYNLWDGNSASNSGYFTIAGVPQAANSVIGLTAAQLAQLSFVSGTVSDTLQVRVYDGVGWTNWQSLTVTAAPNQVPTISVLRNTIVERTTIAASSLFIGNDADRDPIFYNIWDGSAAGNSGFFTLDGVAQSVNSVIGVSDLSRLSFTAGAGGVTEQIQIRAYDGIGWSAWTPLNLATQANALPVVSTNPTTLRVGQTIAASSLFSATDANGQSLYLNFWDGSGLGTTGYFSLNGIVQTSGVTIGLNAADISRLTFTAGTLGDSFSVRAYDGVGWSAWSTNAVTVLPNSLPVVNVSNLGAARGQTFASTSLFTASDADGHSLYYNFWDDTGASSSGNLFLDGVQQTSGRVIGVSGSELSRLTFRAGVTPDTLKIRAYDGYGWSNWNSFTVSPPTNRAPVVTAGNQSVSRGQVLAGSTLFRATDADGDPIYYNLWDGVGASQSGYFSIDGARQGSGSIIGLSASEISSLTFTAGLIPDTLQVRAFDGYAWSNWSSFTVSPPANSTPVVSTSAIRRAAGTVLLASSLFSASDANGDSLYYNFWDGTGAGSSGYFLYNGARQGSGSVIGASAADLSLLSFVVGTTPDSLQVRAYDGIAWSGWSTFSVST